MEEIKKPGLLSVYSAFFRMGAVTFGGGYAMLPILEKEAVEKKGWVTKEEVMDYYAIAQGLPGIIAVNVGILIGHKQRGFWGGLAAALGVVSPCLIIIMLIAACLNNFRDNEYVQHALNGISVCVCALILSSILGLWKKGVKDIPTLCIFLVMLAVSLFTKISPVLCVIAAAVAGIVIKQIGGKKS